ncbi:M20/M25/M40 family metallo-hydrolase [Paenisporosarcina quisquiliarum]|uniref:M20/M25/M40 family metallo-hydrolase n=1 Tax=Paenisporosarcina quisquiliarum TaxID=365346 RepID=A0A9X3RCQ3_9BACL|nr:M20/M25/M40 family metallo-hydrolase [Paenisporosarcina quisquiliarum]MCZ8536656.1 M20/M25/M40 family metallo-hydrolase [Paenisporosarcina quisquiliarum]
MTELMWSTPEALRTLLCEVVSWKSMTLSDGEREFPFKVQSKLQDIPYFHDNHKNIELSEADFGRKFLTALYKHPEAKETIVLISHFDTVNTEEYGDLEALAFEPEMLTKALLDVKDELPEDARLDLESGNYLFGRGTMDMKMGLVLHMSLIEKASHEEWPVNIILLTVPDEEVNSSGMRAAVSKLIDYRTQHHLTYKLFLNSEPIFAQQPGDDKYYLYSGSIGKIMPSALFYGMETHVGEPLSGITANYIASFLTQRMEFNPLFQETVLGEKTPLPVTIQQKDLKMEYSAQTPYRAKALYNVFLMKRNAAEIMSIFEGVANEAADECNKSYQAVCTREGVEPVGDIRVLKYEELMNHAVAKFGNDYVESVKTTVRDHQEWDDREKSFRIVDTLMIQCQELAPAIVLLFAPPYYPAVNTSDDPLVKECVEFVKELGQTEFNLNIEQIHYFNGISDLSYVNYEDTTGGWQVFEANTPVWGDSYSIPFNEMRLLKAPVLNVGPFGKDAHKRTERLHIQSAFVELPQLLENLVKNVLTEKIEA